MNDKPAVLGGLPVFTAKGPIVRPMLPDFDDEFAEGVHGILGERDAYHGPASAPS